MQPLSIEQILKNQYYNFLSLIQNIGNGTYTLPPDVTIPAILVPSANTTRSSFDMNEFRVESAM